MGKIKTYTTRNAPMHPEDLRMEDIHNQIEGKRLRWFRQVKRMDEHRIPKKKKNYWK
jgi:hypothetical protein